MLPWLKIWQPKQAKPAGEEIIGEESIEVTPGSAGTRCAMRLLVDDQRDDVLVLQITRDDAKLLLWPEFQP